LHTWICITPKIPDVPGMGDLEYDDETGEQIVTNVGMQRMFEYETHADLVNEVRDMCRTWGVGFADRDECAEFIAADQMPRTNFVADLAVKDLGYGTGLQLGIIPCDRYGNNTDVAPAEPRGE
jgi:hypothetical protein